MESITPKWPCCNTCALKMKLERVDFDKNESAVKKGFACTAEMEEGTILWIRGADPTVDKCGEWVPRDGAEIYYADVYTQEKDNG